MSPLSNLIELCRLWAKLSASECEAIQMEDWKSVADAQSKKNLLQSKISDSAAACTVEERCSAEIKELSSALVASEKTNQRLLETIRSAAEKRRVRLGGVARNLRKIHGSYAQQPSTVWQSYS
jgi:hypothetical protein